MLRLLSKTKQSKLPLNLMHDYCNLNLATERSLFQIRRANFSSDDAEDDSKAKKKPGFLNWKKESSQQRRERPEANLQRDQQQQQQQQMNEGFKKAKTRNPPKILFQNKPEEQAERHERTTTFRPREHGDTQRARSRFEERRKPEEGEGARERKQPEEKKKLLFQQVSDLLKTGEEEVDFEGEEDTGARRDERDRTDRGEHGERRGPRFDVLSGLVRPTGKPGEILRRTAKEVEIEKEAHIIGIDAETRAKLLEKVSSLDALSKTTDVYQDLIEIYLTLGEIPQVLKLYEEMTNNKVAKNHIIEGFVLDAKTQTSPREALEFFRALKSNEDVLSQIQNHVMQNFLDLQLKKGTTENVQEVLKTLSKINYNFANLELGTFSNFLGLPDFVNEENIEQLSKSSMQSQEILNKLKAFIKAIDLKFRTRKQRKPFLAFDTEKLFRVITASQKALPPTELDNDLFLGLLKKLNEYKLLHEGSVHPDTVAEWILSYSNSARGLEKALSGVALFESAQLDIQSALQRAVSQTTFDGSQNLPFTKEDVQSSYKGLAAQAFIDSSARVCGPQTLVVLSQIALYQKQYDVALACYQNFEAFTKSSQLPAGLLLIVMETFTLLNLKTKNAATIVDGLVQKATENNQILPQLKVTLTKIKALIRDEKFDEASNLYRQKILNQYIVEFQRYVLLNFFIMQYPIEQLLGRDTAEDSHEMLRNFVQSTLIKAD